MSYAIYDYDQYQIDKTGFLSSGTTRSNVLQALGNLGLHGIDGDLPTLPRFGKVVAIIQPISRAALGYPSVVIVHQ